MTCQLTVTRSALSGINTVSRFFTLQASYHPLPFASAEMDTVYEMNGDVIATPSVCAHSVLLSCLFRSLDLLLHFLDSCTPATLINLSATCRSYRVIIMEYSEKSWSILGNSSLTPLRSGTSKLAPRP